MVLEVIRRSDPLHWDLIAAVTVTWQGNFYATESGGGTQLGYSEKTLGSLTDDAGYWRVCGVPRETPLSSIHLRGLATLDDAGAVILFAAPGFYHGADTVQDLVDFVVARCLDQLGIDTSLIRRWGE